MCFIIFVLVFSKNQKVFFKQLRIGLNEKPFIIYKFATMNDLTDEKGQLLPDQQRITNIGVFLRKWSLDELPQFFNVLKGDISFVGPRPLLPEYLPLYTEMERKRHQVKPGITGLAQIKGRNQLSWEQKFYYDLKYVENQSFLLDMNILFRTVWIVGNAKYINEQGLETGKSFTKSRNEMNR